MSSDTSLSPIESTESTVPQEDLAANADQSIRSEQVESKETPAESTVSEQVEPNETEPEAISELKAIAPNAQVRFKTQEDGTLLLLLPNESSSNDANATTQVTWTEILQQIRQRLNAGDRFWQADTSVQLIAQDRLLDGRQLQAIAEALSESKLKLERIETSRRQTAVAAVTAGYSVEQRTTVTPFNPNPIATGKALAEPLYLETTVRSGVDIRHPGNVVLVGDVNPGGSIIADGDILVWGRLRGLAQAGANGNEQCIVMALQMEPTQIRIADWVARAPEPLPDFYPEVAYVSPEGIRIAKAADFSKAQLELKS
ncbi:septum site-determining protein MinC [Laspinema sp. D1]|uniref:Probable septum site-determining protein MinC n=1 Tax=Laspinema palackyanum D2a TaxID=2953684 RepID=A0ABT2MTC5_9CYAN|nr:septum site-determining protein MinC [Laspinema sp. D2a]